MNFYTTNDWRNRRNQRSSSFPAPLFYPVANFTTDAVMKDVFTSKSCLEEIITEESLINDLQNLKNPLQKNLGDSLFRQENKKSGIDSFKTSDYSFGMHSPLREDVDTPGLHMAQVDTAMSRIANFMSKIFSSVTSAIVFNSQKRSTPEDCGTQYPDISRPDMDQLDSGFDEGSPPIMQSNTPDKIKHTNFDCINTIKLSNNESTPTVKEKTMKTTSVDDIFQDAYTAEDFEQFTNDVNCVKSNKDIINKGISKHNTEDSKLDRPTDFITCSCLKMADPSVPKKVGMTFKIQEDMANMPSTEGKSNSYSPKTYFECRHQKKLNSNSKSHCKRFKNPNRIHSDKRKDMNMRKSIEEEMKCFDEIDVETFSSYDESPIDTFFDNLKSSMIHRIGGNCFFDEIQGRFCDSSTTESEDSFQIVFSDNPKQNRPRKLSDCDSEDSFIIFQDDSPDTCYSSTDIFGDESRSIDEDTEDDSDFSDSGCGRIINCAFANGLSRTISDLTDDSLYEETVKPNYVYTDSEDEVDCAFVQTPILEDKIDSPHKLKGILLDRHRKMAKKRRPPKKVQFSVVPPKVHVMRVWTFAARQARAGHWEQYSIDRERFKRRIADVDMAISWVLKPQHRKLVKFHRFMPWWNAQRRLEEAEKKEREAERRIREEETEREADDESTEQKEAAEVLPDDELEDSTTALRELPMKNNNEIAESIEIEDVTESRENMQEINSVRTSVDNKV